MRMLAVLPPTEALDVSTSAFWADAFSSGCSAHIQGLSCMHYSLTWIRYSDSIPDGVTHSLGTGPVLAVHCCTSTKGHPGSSNTFGGDERRRNEGVRLYCQHPFQSLGLLEHQVRWFLISKGWRHGFTHVQYPPLKLHCSLCCARYLCLGVCLHSTHIVCKQSRDAAGGYPL